MWKNSNIDYAEKTVANSFKKRKQKTNLKLTL